MKTYVLNRLDGKTPAKKVTQSTYPRRKGWTVVDSWPANDQHPTTSDGRAHNDWDRRNGRAG
jgi:hypothetical protein